MKPKEGITKSVQCPKHLQHSVSSIVLQKLGCKTDICHAKTTITCASVAFLSRHFPLARIDPALGVFKFQQSYKRENV